MSRKGENIYKRKDGRWESRYVKGYHPDGTPKYGYCYGKTYREAKEKLIGAKGTVLSGEILSLSAGKQTFGPFCDEWLAVNRPHLKEATYAKYRGIIERHIKPALGTSRLQMLSSVEVERFGNDLLCRKNLAPKTVKDIMTLLGSILKYTTRQTSGLRPITEIVYPKIPKHEIRVLTREEQARLVHFLMEDTDTVKFGVLLALLTGMRIGEICALRWGSVSLVDRTVTVAATMQRLQNYSNTEKKKTRVIITEPKSERSVRVIPLTEFAVGLCRSHSCGESSAFVLTGESAHYMEPRVLQYRLEQYIQACGLDDVHFHTLRHTFATRCVEVDFEIKSLSEILGHSSPRITLERYVHSSLSLKRSNMNKLAAIGY